MAAAGLSTLSRAAGRIVRSFRTASGFAYAGWWWTMLGLIGLFVWPLVVILPRRAWRHALVGAAFRTLFRLTGIRFTVEQVAPVPPHDVVIVANHASFVDGGVISAAIGGPLAFVVAERFERRAVAGRLLRALGSIFVDGAMDAALDTLRAGERPVIFPEGHLWRMPGLSSFDPGPFVISAEGGVPVVPVTLIGTRSLLRDGRQWLPRRGPVTVRIGEPIRAEGKDFQAAVELGLSVRAEILAHCQEPDLGRQRPITDVS